MCLTSRSTESPSKKHAKRYVVFPVSVSPLHPTLFDTHSPYTCWNPARMFARYSCCSATAAWRQLRGTCGSPPAKYARHRVHSIFCLTPSALIPSLPRLSIFKRRSDGSPEAGSGGHLPSLRRNLSREVWRVDVHSAATCHDRHRGVSYGGSWKAD